MIIRREARYEFSIGETESLGSKLPEESFYLTFPVPTAEYLKDLTEDTVLMELPGTLVLRVICRSYGDTDPQNISLRTEGCFYFKEEKEWVLEAQCTMCTKDGTYSDTYFVRLPLSAPFAQNGEIGLYFDGTWICFLKDGRVLNENSGLDCFASSKGELWITEGWQDAFRISCVKNVKVTYTETEEEGNADFYTPSGWNVFAGDVMNFYHDGIYHVVFLKDRRHHGSRNGMGAHGMYHITSENLKCWIEREAITVVDRPWKSYGTGTMLFHNGKYYMVYGLHTGRYQGAQEKVVPKLIEETGEVQRLSCKQILAEKKLPRGASYSISEDGIHFVPSGVLHLPVENPSTYVMPDGRVRVYAKGIWESESMEQPFKKMSDSFVFSQNAVMKNTNECPCFFEWNGYKYLIIGITGYYRTLSSEDSEFVDMAGREEIYDGLVVPMVSAYKSDRRLIAGWLDCCSYAGAIIHRELIQEENGKLGLKWVPEMVPETVEENLWSGEEKFRSKISLASGDGCLVEFVVDPRKASRMGIQFTDGEMTCELQLDFTKKRMQMMDTQAGILAESISTTYEVAREQADKSGWWNKPEARQWNLARYGRNFCMADILGMDHPFSVRMLLRCSGKTKSTVIDAEIAGRRTMISDRCDFVPGVITILSEGEIGVADQSIKKLKTSVV